MVDLPEPVIASAVLVNIVEALLGHRIDMIRREINFRGRYNLLLLLL